MDKVSGELRVSRRLVLRRREERDTGETPTQSASNRNSNFAPRFHCHRGKRERCATTLQQ